MTDMRFTKAAIDALAVPEGKSEVLAWDDDMPGFGCRVRAAGSKTWVAQYRIGPQQRRESLGDVRKVDLAAARKVAKQRFASVELGLDPRQDQGKPALKLGKAVAIYLAGKQETMRPTTFAQATYHLQRLWKPLHGRELDGVKRADVAARLQEIIKAHGRTAAARARGNLSAFYTWCMREGFCEQNPVQATNNPAEGIAARERVLSDEEIAAIWHACGDDDFGWIAKLLLLTGCRREEIGGLKRSEVNFETGMLNIPPARIKNKRTLILPLPPVALDILRSVPPREGRDHFFGGAKVGFVAWGWDKMKIDARITAQRGTALDRWTLHDCRRTMRTGLGRLGIAPHVAELTINHAKGGVQAIYDRYSYLPQIGAALAAWAAHIEQLMITGGKFASVTPLRA
jgi:integrase